jgi:tRNA threonylcarbamoyladenosine biosynthesis protein TsaE
MMAAWTLSLPDEEAAQAFARRFSGAVRPPMVIYLEGDLGAGKTTFARAYIHGLGYKGYVKSPSYGLLETYRVDSQQVLHLDLYRIEDPEELEYLALRDLYDGQTVLLVEWPDRGGGLLPAPDLVLKFDENHESRFVRISAKSKEGQVLSQLIEQADSDAISN